mmetsp:Transcript_40756/g.81652  ORF Transcript_40756/g.81652 Transcript_40756/m.81652 type:complete len:158 (+) Transcript_40756:35-508(+)|eukprot:CAMPEP_0196719520 /NCGR_PEP_ID=MMETSP1091-20130531/2466_1 /TAXON_ID=302021 /ORGANISM="Rhodomonas sp., Strain CCMP768" /LENGTH=157 /DNA_ID=CAMNT_0042060485 /DNA_START=405 /DNA_END=878 /DNA_ORIENTATION=-
MSDAEDDYDAADAGAADCTPCEAGSVRKGQFLKIKGRPCKIIDTSKAKVGKHGAAKCSFTGTDIFTGKKLECVAPAGAQLAQPIVDRTDLQLVDVTDEGFLSLMTDSAETRDDMKLPDDSALAEKIKNLFDEGKDLSVTVLKACGQEQVIDVKTIST